jgi:hypothetical protein
MYCSGDDRFQREKPFMGVPPVSSLSVRRHKDHNGGWRLTLRIACQTRNFATAKRESMQRQRTLEFDNLNKPALHLARHNA